MIYTYITLTLVFIMFFFMIDIIIILHKFINHVNKFIFRQDTSIFNLFRYFKTVEINIINATNNFNKKLSEIINNIENIKRIIDNNLPKKLNEMQLDGLYVKQHIEDYKKKLDAVLQFANDTIVHIGNWYEMDKKRLEKLKIISDNIIKVNKLFSTNIDNAKDIYDKIESLDEAINSLKKSVDDYKMNYSKKSK